MLFITFAVVAVGAVAATLIIDRPVLPHFGLMAAFFAVLGAVTTGFIVPGLLMGDPANPTTSTETFALQALGGNPGSTPVYTSTPAQGAEKGEITFMYDDHGTVRQATSAPNLVSFVEDAGQPHVEVRHTKVSHGWLIPFERNGYDQYVLHVPVAAAGQKPAR